MERNLREVRRYITANGKCPFATWFDSLHPTVQARIDQAQDKIRLGLLTSKNSRSLGSGVFEFKMDFGPGYRIYFGQVSSNIILLWGGDKSTQEKDILKAKEYWADYEEREGTSE